MGWAGYRRRVRQLADCGRPAPNDAIEASRCACITDALLPKVPGTLLSSGSGGASSGVAVPP